MNKNFEKFYDDPTNSINNETTNGYDDLLEIQEKCLISAKQFKYKKNSNFMLRNNLMTTLNNEFQQKRRNILATNRLSCEELENLKERFVDFIKYETSTLAESEVESLSPAISLIDKIHIQQQQQQQTSKPSKSCAQLSYYSNQNFKNEYSKLKPEPPERTVSIRHSTIYSPASYSISTTPGSTIDGEILTAEDTFTIKSVYSSCASSTTSSSSSSSSSSVSANSTNLGGSISLPLRSCKSVFSINEEDHDGNYLIKTERLHENDITRIQSMYRSVNCIILVSSCTIDFYTTNSEQIASLQDCWKIELNSVVPVWIFDRSYKRLKEKCLKLLFVDKLTGFPVYKEILITKLSQFKNPKDRRLTFTVGNFICLINFHDFFSCNEFYKFFLELQIYLYESTLQNKNNNSDIVDFNKIKSNRIRSKSREILATSGRNLTTLSSKSSLIKFTDDTDLINIKKNCISNPCAFQHINSLKNGDKRIQMLIENKKLK